MKRVPPGNRSDNGAKRCHLCGAADSSMNRVTISHEGTLICSRCIENTVYTAVRCGRCSHEWVSSSNSKATSCPRCGWESPRLFDQQPWHYAADNAYASTSGRPKIKTSGVSLSDKVETMVKVQDTLCKRMSDLEMQVGKIRDMLSTLDKNEAIRQDHAASQFRVVIASIKELTECHKDLIEELSE